LYLSDRNSCGYHSIKKQIWRQSNHDRDVKV
jgi:hypothetical protein